MGCVECGAAIATARSVCFECGAYQRTARPTAATPARGSGGVGSGARAYELDERQPFEGWVRMAIDYGAGALAGTLVVLALVHFSGGGISRESLRAAGRELWLPGMLAGWTLRALFDGMALFATPGQVAVAYARGRLSVSRAEFVASFALALALMVLMAALPIALLLPFREDVGKVVAIIWPE
jgi:hypothetical protein